MNPWPPTLFANVFVISSVSALQPVAVMSVVAENASTDLELAPGWNLSREGHLQTLDILLKKPYNAPTLLLSL